MNKSKVETLCFKVTFKEKLLINTCANKEDKNLSEFLREVILEYINKEKKK